MTLGFMQKFPWTENKQPVPTNFREKILANYIRFDALGVKWNMSIEKYNKIAAFEKQSLMTVKFQPKLHTMRIDPHNRWRAGMSIQMVYRGPKYSILDHFNKGIPELEECKSTQAIKIIWFNKNQYVETILPTKFVKGPHGKFEFFPRIWIDGRQLKEPEILTLAQNDGFDSVEDFFRWFKKDWSGKLIHWSPLRY